MTTTDDLRIEDLGAEPNADLDAERQADVSMLLSALSPLAVADIAVPAATVRGVNEPECRSTRAALHDYLARRLRPRRRLRLETHLDGCTGCIRAFIDIREVSWTHRTVASTATSASLAATSPDGSPARRDRTYVATLRSLRRIYPDTDFGTASMNSTARTFLYRDT